MIVNKLKPYLPFILFAMALFIAVFVIEKINGRFWLNDFKVYYSAARALLKGEQVYGVSFGLDTGYYKYSPFVALLFAPYTFLPYEVAIIIHFFVLSAATILSVIMVGKLVRLYFSTVKSGSKNLFMSLSLLCILLHLVRELHLGNINILLLLFATAGLIFSLQSKPVLSGIFIGLAVIIKPYFLVLILPFAAAGKWRVLLSTGTIIALSFIAPMLFWGYSKNILLYAQWVDSMRQHSSYLTSHHTIESLLNYYLGFQTGNWFTYFLIAVTCTAYLFFYFLMKARLPKNETATTPSFYFISGYFCLLALIPNLVITDTEHFLLSLPLVMILLGYVSEKKKYLLIAAFIVLIFFYEGNSTDLLGKDLSQRFEQAGLLGISNLIIIAWVLMLNLRQLRRPTENNL